MREVIVTIGQEKRKLAIGSTVGEALLAFGLKREMGTDYQTNPFVCALVNDNPEGFSSLVLSDCTIIPVRLFSDMGKRCYRQSLCYLLSAAARICFPNRRLIIGFALGDGYYFTFNDRYLITSSTVEKLITTMRDIVARSITIEQEILPFDDACALLKTENLNQTVDLLETTNDPTVSFYKMDGFRDISYEPIVQNSAILSVWELKLHGGNGLLLRYPRSFDFTKLDTFKDNHLLFAALQQNKMESPILQPKSIGELSKLYECGDTAPFIRLCEEYQSKKIADIADMICKKSSVRFVLIAGPSSSGKTTFAYKLCTQLQVRGKQTLKISLDNYYRPHDQVPKDTDGKPDLECIEALNLPLFQQNMADLAEGKTVRIPEYDFSSQTSVLSRPIKMDGQTVLVIEGIHGMNPILCGSLDNELIFRVYISAFTQMNIDDHNRISTTDNRIIRRIVRDHRTRGSSAEKTLSMFPSVQRGENLYIFPYQNNADVMINSALDYELAVLAPFAEPLLRMVKPEPTNVYVTARRLMHFLSHFPQIPDTMVPSDSLLREFIGGSEYNVT